MNLKEISIQVIVISLLVFSLTMLIKWPIKKITAKLEENKRKAINTVIVFIPMVLAFVFSVLYFGIFENKWLDLSVYDTTASSYLLAVTIYAIYSRIVILIKGTKTSSVSADELEISSENFLDIKKNIKTLSKSLKLDEKKLENIVADIEKLLIARNSIVNNTSYQNISQAEKIDIQIRELEFEKDEVTNNISEKQEEIELYQKSLIN